MTTSSLKRLLGRSVTKDAALTAYHIAVEQARSPIFYQSEEVPDTLDGRFEMILVHIFLILHRVRNEAIAQDFAQALFDLLFGDMDRSLREMGVGDLSVGREVKAMAQGFYGRIEAYAAGLANTGLPGETELSESLKRNLYGTLPNVSQSALDWMASYLGRQAAALSVQPLTEVVQGRLQFAVASQ